MKDPAEPGIEASLKRRIPIYTYGQGPESNHRGIILDFLVEK